MTQPSEDPGTATPDEGGENRIPETRVKSMVAKAREEASAEAESRMQALLGDQATKTAELEGRIQALSQQAERPPATRQELRLLVDEGKITQDHMDAELEKLLSGE